MIGDTIAVSDTIPKGILQKDFFASIVKMFNLMIKESKEVDKQLVIEPYVDFFNISPTSYLDWSDKVDRSKPYIIKPMSEINARYYTLKYKSDTDYWNDKYKKKWAEGYGDRLYDNEMEFAKNTDGLEVIFSATPSVGYTGTGYDKVFPAIYKLNNNVEEITEFNIRILFARKISSVTSWKILKETRNLFGIYDTYGTFTSYGYAGHYDSPTAVTYDLNFGALKELFYDLPYSIFYSGLSNNLFNLFYSSYFAEITDKDSRLVTYTMKFDPKDIYKLDFGIFVYVDNILYRLIRIIDYVDGETCKVELLRVIYVSYY